MTEATNDRGRRGRGAKRSGKPKLPPEELEANLALFASYVKDDQAKAKAARKAEQQSRKEAEAARRLVDEKDAAAARLKALRSRSGVSAEERAEAEEAYRRALAAVVADETGQAPAWAPPEPEPEPAEAMTEAETEADPGAEGEAEPAQEPEPEPAEATTDASGDDAEPSGDTEPS